MVAVEHVALHWSCFAASEPEFLVELELLLVRLIRGGVPVSTLVADAEGTALHAFQRMQLPGEVASCSDPLADCTLKDGSLVLFHHSCSPSTVALLQRPPAATVLLLHPNPTSALPGHGRPKDVIRHIIQSHFNLPNLLVVGFLMKASRERDLAAKSMFPILPTTDTSNPVVFHPLDLDEPLTAQLPFHVILHKASDELIYAPGTQSTPQFSPRVQHISAFLHDHLAVCIVDPLTATSRLIDRAAISAVLSTLPSLPTRIPVRAPKDLITPSFTAPDLPARLSSAALTAPYIVKPTVACGVSDSHQMALVLADRALPALSIPVPAMIQEYVNHGGLQYKVYVMGSHVTYTPRASIPDLHIPDPPTAASAPLASLYHDFDSLKSLPKQLPASLGTAAPPAATAAPCHPPPPQPPPATSSPPPATAPLSTTAGTATTSGTPSRHQQQQQPLDQQVLEQVAGHLRQQLQLTLFGFDVVVNQATGEYLVIDVNYFPNYREVAEAPAHFRVALRAAYVAHEAARAGGSSS